MSTEKKVAFAFGLGHGRASEFLNFQHCCPPEYRERTEWIGLHTDTSGDLLARLSFVPSGERYRRHEFWNLKQGIKKEKDWDAVFLAAMQQRFRGILRKYRCYHYRDSSPSLKVELAPWYDNQINGHPLKEKLKRKLETQLLHQLHGTFTMSRWGANGVMRDYGLSPDRVHVALPGANLDKIAFVDRADRSGSGPVRILMVGGEFRRKGGEQLLQWAETTDARGWELDIVTWPGDLPDWVKQILGAINEKSYQSVSLAPRLPQVRVHCGLRANTPELLRLIEEADIFCLPTLADGSSLASLEAMAGGLPVVVGAVGGIPELIDNGKTGFLVRRGDVKDLGEQLETLIADRSLRICVGRNARKACEEYYNVERQIRDIFTVIDRDAGRKFP